MICDICKKGDSVHYRVTSTKTSNWIFVCKKCLMDFAKTEGYKYGGTRKGNRRKNVKVHKSS